MDWAMWQKFSIFLNALGMNTREQRWKAGVEVGCFATLALRPYFSRQETREGRPGQYEADGSMHCHLRWRLYQSSMESVRWQAVLPYPLFHPFSRPSIWSSIHGCGSMWTVFVFLWQRGIYSVQWRYASRLADAESDRHARQQHDRPWNGTCSRGLRYVMFHSL